MKCDIIYYRSDYPNITLDIVNQYPKIPWNYVQLATNSNWEIYKATYCSYFEGISCNPNITLQIYDNPSINWNYKQVIKL